MAADFDRRVGLLLAMPVDDEVLDRVDADPQATGPYWADVGARHVPAAQLGRFAAGLVQHGRPVAGAVALGGAPSDHEPPDIELAERVLRAVVGGAEQDLGGHPAYFVGRLIDALEAGGLPDRRCPTSSRTSPGWPPATAFAAADRGRQDQPAQDPDEMACGQDRLAGRRLPRSASAGAG